MNFEMSCDIPTPPNTPSTPPIPVNTQASVRNWARILRRFAPMAFFRPISVVRSVTVTSMMFMTPTPPTSSEMLAIQMSWLLVELLIS